MIIIPMRYRPVHKTKRGRLNDHYVECPIKEKRYDSIELKLVNIKECFPCQYLVKVNFNTIHCKHDEGEFEKYPNSCNFNK